MRRRGYLSGVGTIGLVSIVGCAGGTNADGSPTAEPAEFDVVDATLETPEIGFEEAAEITATIRYTGGQGGDFTVELVADGEVVESKQITLSEGEERTVSVEHPFQEIGTHDLQINDASVGSLTVEPLPSDDEFFTSLVVKLLEEKEIQVASIEVANGRGNGGQKGAIITYRTSSINAVTGSEMGTFVAAFTNAVEMGWDIDATTVIVGDGDGTAIGAYVIEAEWARSNLNGEITTEEYYSKTRGTFTLY